MTDPGSLELRFRSSQAITATSDANFGIKGAQQVNVSSAIFEFEAPTDEIVATLIGTSNSPRQCGGSEVLFIIAASPSRELLNRNHTRIIGF